MIFGVLHKNIRSPAVTLNIENATPLIKVSLKVLPMQLRGPGGIVDVITFFDDSSDITLLDSSIAVKLGLNGIPTPLCCNWRSNTTPGKMIGRKKLCWKYHKISKRKNVRTMKDLDLPTQ
jgi:hypothetical protein